METLTPPKTFILTGFQYEHVIEVEIYKKGFLFDKKYYRFSDIVHIYVYNNHGNQGYELCLEHSSLRDVVLCKTSSGFAQKNLRDQIDQAYDYLHREWKAYIKRN
jgi:hypothetical protein